ncbi:PCYCGC domain-containing protein [Brevibacillus humidisoli]|uniref:PCYCGC domain-containing protein n=1 Tax=Brevibacillus humidisoli TaxID=2895522 RepID=UPI001E62CC02|nr:PCYCGC domain-containing protein [Brevibacillus humidisoli]UFJ40562.1 PCYCGC domain-containing protein [Brevibacillus humidisoli]
MKRVRFLYIGLLSFSLVVGCSSASEDSAAEVGHQQHAPNGDLQELTASIEDLPSFLDQVDPRIKEVYQIAGQHQDTLQHIPCYCGCGESAGHQHNGNCFIKEVKEDGSVLWDDHGTRCGVCLEIAYVSSELKDQGKSVHEIRTLIDEKYKSGYAKPTPTPMPNQG